MECNQLQVVGVCPESPIYKTTQIGAHECARCVRLRENPVLMLQPFQDDIGLMVSVRTNQRTSVAY